MRNLLSEYIGTFAIVFAGTGAAVSPTVIESFFTADVA